MSRWSRRWLEAIASATAVSGSASPPPGEHPAGKTLARRFAAEVEIEFGQVTARFPAQHRRRPTRPSRHGSHRSHDPFDDQANDVRSVVTATVGVRPLTDDEWSRLVTQLGTRPSVTASVLVGDLPPELGDALVPTWDDLSWVCTCEAWEEPCRHTWAVLLHLAERIETDPNLLLVLRSRNRAALLGALDGREPSGPSQTGPTSRHGPDGEITGDDPAQAFGREPAELPRPLALPWRPGTVGAWPVAVPADSGLDMDDLRALVADAADRATRLLSGDEPSGLYLSRDEDLIRRVATGEAAADSVAEVLGATRAEVEARAEAWRIGGPRGLSVHDDGWPAEDAALGAAVDALGGGRSFANVVQHRGTQLRVDQSGAWWRFRPDDALGWVLAGGPFDEPADALED